MPDKLATLDHAFRRRRAFVRIGLACLIVMVGASQVATAEVSGGTPSEHELHGAAHKSGTRSSLAAAQARWDFFTNYGHYMPRIHCLRTADGTPDWPWITALIVLQVVVTAGYLKIFQFWLQRYRAEQLGDRNKKLMDLAFVFLLCGLTGYGVATVIFFWPVYRLQALMLVALSVVTWRFAWNLKPFAVSFQAVRLQRELGETLHDRTAILEEANQELQEINRTLEREVAERRRVQERMQNSKQLVQSVLESASEGILVVDTRGEYLCFNSAAERLFGQGAIKAPPEEWPRIYGIFKPDQVTLYPFDELPIVRAMEGETTVDCELVIRRENAEEGTSVSVNAVPLLDVQGRRMGGVAVFRDVTERKKLQCELSQAQKLEAIGQLAAGIAHEINTPMQCVGSNVEFLKNCYDRLLLVLDKYCEIIGRPERDWEDRREEMRQLMAECRYEHIRQQAPAAIETAADAANRVIDIVRAMKAMCHPGTEDKVSTDLNLLIRNAATISRNRWKYLAKLDLQLDDALPDVQTLPAELNQVVLNLIVNAADAILEKNGEDPAELGSIAIRTRAENGCAILEVQDDGCGIPEGIKTRVFDPFFTTKEVGKGTGQGLAITYDVVVKKHGGSIEVATECGKGTTFFISLPLGRPADRDAHEDEISDNLVVVSN